MNRPVTPPSAYELMVLAGLQKKALYQGTADPQVVRARRARNRAASASRRKNRAK